MRPRQLREQPESSALCLLNVAITGYRQQNGFPPALLWGTESGIIKTKPQACQSSRSAWTMLSRHTVGLLGLSCAGRAAGLDGPRGSLPTRDIPRFSPPPGCGNGVSAAARRPPPEAVETAPRLRAPEGHPPRPAPPTTASRWRRLQHAQRLGGFSCPGLPAWGERPARRSG